MRIPKFNITHAVLFIVVAGLMVTNAILLYYAQHKVQTEKQAAEEAAKPAAIEVVVISAADCKECVDIENLIAPLKNNPKVNIIKEQTVDYATEEGKVLVQKYNLTRVPSLLLRGQTIKVFDPASFTQNLGKQDPDGTLVITNVPPPFMDLSSRKVTGLFSATYLTDKSCKECYATESHRQALAGLGMKPAQEIFVDRAEAAGQALIGKYAIKSAPTIVLTGDLAVYAQFNQVWSQVGTVEKDGAHVFRAGQALMGAYQDLVTGKIVKPKPPEPAANAPTAATPAQKRSATPPTN